MSQQRHKIENPFLALPNFNCFACGPNHSHGLHLSFFKNGQSVECELTAEKAFDGITGILHGGIQSTVLDEVMWWAVFAFKERFCVTQSMSIDFKGIVRTGEALLARGEITEEHRNTVHTRGEILCGSRVLAAARATYFLPNEKLFARAQGIKVNDLPEIFRRFLKEPA